MAYTLLDFIEELLGIWRGGGLCACMQSTQVLRLLPAAAVATLRIARIIARHPIPTDRLLVTLDRLRSMIAL